MAVLHGTAFAKLNLDLRIRGVREDGYHLIDTLFQTIDFADTIRMDAQASGVTLVVEGDYAAGAPPGEGNLVTRAASALKAHAGYGGGARLTLTKSIPTGAGLGGGSSDAAVTLLGLNRLWDLQLADEDLQAIARGLGADVPFFLHGGAAQGTGIGDEITPIDDLPERWVVLVVCPDLEILTRDAYRDFDFLLTSPSVHSNMDDASEFTYQTATGVGLNDLEEVIHRRYPALRELKSRIRKTERNAGALMTGSGPSHFGLYPDRDAAAAAAMNLTQHRERALLTRFVGRGEYCRTIIRAAR